ncbi:MAG TPA: VWA domain-containing protein [Bryobacteraceae bacterium]|nr:VWA domain-containing protein [Bryobacteraceae bacterium]
MRRYVPLLLAAILASAQDDVPLFRTGVSLVKVDAEVEDTSGAGIPGLRPNDFRVYDEGQPQAISDFASEAQPLHVLMLLDVSPSMSKWLGELGSKSTESLGALRAGDKVALMGFATRQELLQPLTTSKSEMGVKIIGNIYKQTLGRETVVNEAILAASKYMGGQAGKRRAILIVTDNEGARKAVSDDEVVRALHSSNIVFSAILVGNAPAYAKTRYESPGSAPPNVERFVAETGGEVIRGAAPANALQPMLKGLTTRYTFQYTAPPAEDGTFRRIRVELTPEIAAKYPGARVKARSGYTAGK